jgi:large subunit ribosomal protein L10
VKEQRELRRGLRAAGGEFRVVKMTLARRAADELGRPAFKDLLGGPAGLAYAYDDPSVTARLLRDFSRDHTRLLVKGALFGADVLPPERVAALADLEPRPVLLARVAGALQAPLAAMAGVLAAVPRGLANVLSALADKKPAPAEPAAEIATEAVTEAATEVATEAVTEVATEVATEAATEAAAEIATEAAAETATEIATETLGSEAAAAAEQPAEEAATSEADKAEEE